MGPKFQRERLNKRHTQHTTRAKKKREMAASRCVTEEKYKTRKYNKRRLANRDGDSSMPPKCTNHTDRTTGEGETKIVINSISYKTFCFPRHKKCIVCWYSFFPPPSLMFNRETNVGREEARDQMILDIIFLNFFTLQRYLKKKKNNLRMLFPHQARVCVIPHQHQNLLVSKVLFFSVHCVLLSRRCDQSGSTRSGTRWLCVYTSVGGGIL